MGTKSTEGESKNPIPQDNAGLTTSSTMDTCDVIDSNDTINQDISPASTPISSRSSKKSSTKNQKEDTSLEFIWICTECREAECVTHPDSPLLVCEGSCLRPFHYPCAGLPSLPPNDESWICHDCTMNKHECCVCHEYGEDNIDVYKCEKKDCGLFYHEACLSMYDVDVVVEAVDSRVHTFSSSSSCSSSNDDSKEEMQIDHNMGTDDEEDDTENENKVLISSGSNSRPKFTCPAHSCWTCSGGPPPDMEESTEPTTTVNSNDDKLTKKQGKTKKGAKKGENAFSEKKEKRLFVSIYENIMY